MSQTRRFREHLPFTPAAEPNFRWRGRGVSRLEGFTDSVFAFAVTLLVVALEVPDNFDGLMDVLRGFPAFIASFTLLILFWNSHFKFFRRYGLDDSYVRWVNYGILLMILFSVYPLKFVFSALFGGAHSARIETIGQMRTIFRCYGLGFACIWSLFALLQRHAEKFADILQLTPAERVITRMTLIEYQIQIGVCLLSIGLTFVPVPPSLPGFTYAIIGPLLTWNGRRHARQIHALTAPVPV